MKKFPFRKTFMQKSFGIHKSKLYNPTDILLDRFYFVLYIFFTIVSWRSTMCGNPSPAYLSNDKWWISVVQPLSLYKKKMWDSTKFHTFLNFWIQYLELILKFGKCIFRSKKIGCKVTFLEPLFYTFPEMRL